MSLYKELDYTEKVREINGVQFSVMGPEKYGSVLLLMSHKLYCMIQMEILL